MSREWINTAKQMTGSEKELTDLLQVVQAVLDSPKKYEEQTATYQNKLRLSIQKIADIVEKIKRSGSEDKEKMADLDILVAKICQSSDYKLLDQCVTLTPEKMRNLDILRISELIQRQPSRYENQLQEKILEFSKKRQTFAGQRYEMSDDLEKSLFFSKLGGQVEKSSKRLDSQSASFVKRDRRMSEIQSILGNVKSEKFDNQTAEFRNSLLVPRESSHIRRKSTSS